jgi:hypothetical protein
MLTKSPNKQMSHIFVMFVSQKFVASNSKLVCRKLNKCDGGLETQHERVLFVLLSDKSVRQIWVFVTSSSGSLVPLPHVTE